MDARPSDGLNLALLMGAPILVGADVLAASGDCPVEEWSRRDELTDGAAVIAAQVRAGWDECAQQRSADSDIV